MLRFFRHIRKQLVEQNKVHKYLLYALCEIMLVVIEKTCPAMDYLSVELKKTATPHCADRYNI